MNEKNLIPFDVNTAKDVQEGKIKGRIVTRDGLNVRILCFDAKRDDNIVALIKMRNGVEMLASYNSTGQYYISVSNERDLFIEL